MVSQPQDPEKQQLPFYLDAHTKGGVVVLGLVLFLAPLLVYALATHLFAMEGVVAGPWIAGTYVVTLLTGWLVTLLSRIVNKEMTYAKQLKDYENQVLAKRLEELDEDERQAVLEDMERDSFWTKDHAQFYILWEVNPSITHNNPVLGTFVGGEALK